MNAVFVFFVTVNLIYTHNAYSPFDEHDQLLTVLEQQLTTELGNLLDTFSKLSDEQLQHVEGSGETVMENIDIEEIKAADDKLPRNRENSFPSKYRETNNSKIEISSGASEDQITLSNLFLINTTMLSLINDSTTTSTEINTFNLSTYYFFESNTSTKPPFQMENTTLQMNNKQSKMVCSNMALCYDDKNCGKGQCVGASLGRCNCRACLNNRSCNSDIDCGGLRRACQRGTCRCAEALAHHGFVFYIDAITQFCDRQQCSFESDQCYGLPCSVGYCRC